MDPKYVSDMLKVKEIFTKNKIPYELITGYYVYDGVYLIHNGADILYNWGRSRKFIVDVEYETLFECSSNYIQQLSEKYTLTKIV